MSEINSKLVKGYEDFKNLGDLIVLIVENVFFNKIFLIDIKGIIINKVVDVNNRINIDLLIVVETKQNLQTKNIIFIFVSDYVNIVNYVDKVYYLLVSNCRWGIINNILISYDMVLSFLIEKIFPP